VSKQPTTATSSPIETSWKVILKCPNCDVRIGPIADVTTQRHDDALKAAEAKTGIPREWLEVVAYDVGALGPTVKA